MQATEPYPESVLTGAAALAPELADRVAAELAPGEQLLWAGRPRQRPGAGWRLLGTWILAVAFGLGFGYWFGSGDPTLILVVGGGIAFLAGVVAVAVANALRTRRRTVYAVTDRRAVLFEPTDSQSWSVQSFTAEGLAKMARTEGYDGAGKLVFDYRTRMSGDRGWTTEVGFLDIDNVRAVEALIRANLLDA